MPIFQNCEHKWSWKQTCKRYFTLDTGMTCPYCAEKQYVTSRTRKKSNMLLFIAPCLMLINVFIGPSLVILLCC
ncbi:TIGR04104 family putative zinc finger protein [Virgibacillus salidurans]|uniref:TIGR04104 family putative zinc finger protein n=1 Tax=Virgibacillus salidurans TaxID=2831673 RepID=UPI001F18D79C|nr:TIGR04104 family putative zinc finger protein [Virgibacillus sp. NKC19-16]